LGPLLFSSLNSLFKALSLSRCDLTSAYLDDVTHGYSVDSLGCESKNFFLAGAAAFWGGQWLSKQISILHFKMRISFTGGNRDRMGTIWGQSFQSLPKTTYRYCGTEGECDVSIKYVPDCLFTLGSVLPHYCSTNLKSSGITYAST